MTIQFVGGQYHGECQTHLKPDYGGCLCMPPIRGHTIQVIAESGDWFPMEKCERQVYRDTGHETVVAGESRRVFVYTGR